MRERDHSTTCSTVGDSRSDYGMADHLHENGFDVAHVDVRPADELTLLDGYPGHDPTPDGHAGRARPASSGASFSNLSNPSSISPI